MKKLIVALFCILILSDFIIAEITPSRFKITESENEFDVLYFVTPDMKVIEVQNTNDINTTQSFEILKNNLRGELRYSLFTDLGGESKVLKTQFAIWVFMCINNIAGFEVSGNSISNFNDRDVKNEFNGDFGCTVFIQNPKSEYGEGFQFMMVEFFCRENYGIVMRSFLFNDIKFVGMNPDGSISNTSPLFSNYHTFKYMEKDNNGNFTN